MSTVTIVRRRYHHLSSHITGEETSSPLAPLEHHHRPATPQRHLTANHNNQSRKATTHTLPMTSCRNHTAGTEADSSTHIHNPPTIPRRRLQEDNDAGAPLSPGCTQPRFSPGMRWREEEEEEGNRAPPQEGKRGQSHCWRRGRREVDRGVSSLPDLPPPCPQVVPKHGIQIRPDPQLAWMDEVEAARRDPDLAQPPRQTMPREATAAHATGRASQHMQRHPSDEVDAAFSSRAAAPAYQSSQRDAGQQEPRRHLHRQPRGNVGDHLGWRRGGEARGEACES